MTKIALHAAAMIDSHGDWTGKYDIHSATQFLAHPQAQEKALTDFLGDIERQLRTNGAARSVGRTIDGQRGVFPVTLAGLIAAAHREGAPQTRRYLDTATLYGFVTRGHNLSPEYLSIETRLRTFSNARYQ